jgi:hypothetical protein
MKKETQPKLPTWEYTIAHLPPAPYKAKNDAGEEIEKCATDVLNDLGAQGWEVVHISPDGYTAWLKRPAEAK